jgi:proteasome lid subunit RPN8/RPN11
MGFLHKLIPSFIKPLLRFIHYPQERAKVFREPRIRKIQNEQIKQFDAKAKKVILFLIAGADYFTGIDKISGGIISIVSLCEESKKLKGIHGAEVILCTFPMQHLLAKHTQFKNDTDVFRYDQLADYFEEATEVMVHLPEYLCHDFLRLNDEKQFEWLKKGKQIHINILNQNIILMPSLAKINELKSCASVVTATTAHQQYCTSVFREMYQISLHKFSVWISPEKYFFKSYSEKENRIVVSPDSHPDKDLILSKMMLEIPGLQIKVIQNLTYEQYKQTISNAKWTLTFGEGLDGYLIEPIFSGAIGFGVYNEDFFTSDFSGMKTIYKSMKELQERIVIDMQNLDNESAFQSYQEMQFDLCAKYYSKDEYHQNIVAFYKKEYTYA